MMRELPMGLGELPLCVRYRHEITTGNSALTQGGFHGHERCARPV